MSHPLIVEQRPPRRRPALKGSILWVAFAISGGCVLEDGNDRCGPNQLLWSSNERCVCAEGTAYMPEQGCVPCGEHEVAAAAGCVCETGYGRTPATGLCEPIPEGIGTPCTSNAECLNPAFPHCQLTPSGEGYCTTLGCVDDAGCSGGYACNITETPSFCQRPPTGNGVPCTSDADCAGYDASYCEVFVSGTCLVRDCSVTPDSCFTGFECCDLTPYSLPTLCLAEGLCQE